MHKGVRGEGGGGVYRGDISRKHGASCFGKKNGRAAAVQIYAVMRRELGSGVNWGVSGTQIFKG